MTIFWFGCFLRLRHAGMVFASLTIVILVSIVPLKLEAQSSKIKTVDVLPGQTIYLEFEQSIQQVTSLPKYIETQVIDRHLWLTVAEPFKATLRFGVQTANQQWVIELQNPIPSSTTKEQHSQAFKVASHIKLPYELPYQLPDEQSNVVESQGATGYWHQDGHVMQAMRMWFSPKRSDFFRKKPWQLNDERANSAVSMLRCSDMAPRQCSTALQTFLQEVWVHENSHPDLPQLYISVYVLKFIPNSSSDSIAIDLTAVKGAFLASTISLSKLSSLQPTATLVMVHAK